MGTDIYLVALGAVLRYQRSKVKSTQNEVAHKAQISPSLYSLIETGKHVPSQAVLTKVIAALHIETSLTTQINILVAKAKGLQEEEAGLPEEVQALLLEIRNSANLLPTHFVNALRKEIHELAK